MNDCPSCVLVVDDDPSIRKMIAMFLAREGFIVSQAPDGQQALVLMAGGEVHLVVLDLMMPVMTGYEVLRIRAADSALRQIPVIVVTANFDSETASILDKGICGLLPKPFEIAALTAMVTACLQHPHGAAKESL